MPKISGTQALLEVLMGAKDAPFIWLKAALLKASTGAGLGKLCHVPQGEHGSISHARMGNRYGHGTASSSLLMAPLDTPRLPLDAPSAWLRTAPIRS